jgi:hypothetical protein
MAEISRDLLCRGEATSSLGFVAVKKVGKKICHGPRFVLKKQDCKRQGSEGKSGIGNQGSFHCRERWPEFKGRKTMRILQVLLHPAAARQ